MLEYAETSEAFDVIQPGLFEVNAMTELIVDIHKDMWQTANDRTHWARKAKRTKAVRLLANMTARSQKLTVPTPCIAIAQIGYLAADKSRVDVDNAQPTLKAVLDGITDAGAWADDDSKSVGEISYRRGPRSPVKDHYRIHLKFIDQRIPF